MLTIDNFHKLTKKEKKEIFKHHDETIEKLVASLISHKRFEHSLSVAKVAMSLAKKHHLDVHKAYLAGILHDITKDLSYDEHLSYLKYYDPDKCDEPRPILHSYSAKYFIKEKFNYYDKEVLNAVYHHTDGESKAKLAMIIYIADKREPLRKLDDNLLEMAYDDLYKAFALLKEDVKEFVKSKNG